MTDRKVIGSLLKRQKTQTNLQKLLRDHKISCDLIESESGVPKTTVSRVLKKAFCGRCDYFSVLRVRATIASLLDDKIDDDVLLAMFEEYDLDMVA